MAHKELKQDICAINWHSHKLPFQMFEVWTAKRQNDLKFVFIHPPQRIQAHVSVGREFLLHPPKPLTLLDQDILHPTPKYLMCAACLVTYHLNKVLQERQELHKLSVILVNKPTLNWYPILQLKKEHFLVSTFSCLLQIYKQKFCQLKLQLCFNVALNFHFCPLDAGKCTSDALYKRR
jgi:hypothetical protein